MSRRLAFVCAMLAATLGLGACGSGAITALPGGSSSTPATSTPTGSIVGTTATGRPAPSGTQTPSKTPHLIPSTPPPPPTRSGVRGTITASPTCPVERPDEPCPPNPVSATVFARDRSGRRVGETGSDADGRYAMDLPAGSYTLAVDTGSQFPTCPESDVTVPEGAVVTADIDCDTGIR